MAMETSGKSGVTIRCDCGWTRPVQSGETPENAVRYHRVLVHNDQAAARDWRF